MGLRAPSVETQGWRAYLRLGESRIDSKLMDLLDEGRGILLSARSSAHGEVGREAVIKDAQGLLEDLQKHLGLLLVDLLPDAGMLDLMLREAHSHHSKDKDGVPMEHRFVVVDLVPGANIKLMLTLGSGSKYTKGRIQPFVVRAAAEFEAIDGAFFAMKRFDRSMRTTWELGPLIGYMEDNGCYIYAEEGLRLVDPPTSAAAFQKGASGKLQAQTLPVQLRRDMVSRSGTKMINGQARYHGGPSVPPGFGIAWLHNPGGAPQERLVYLDSDRYRPDDADVAWGLSDVRRPTADGQLGNRVDQVANVRFVLERLHLEGWSKARIGHELMTRNVSTQRKRDVARDRSARIETHESAKTFIRSIEDNLVVYETGLLVRHVGHGYVVEIDGCTPEGGWATTAAFDRIRKAKSEEGRGPALLAFVGTAASYNGVAVTIGARRGEDDEINYRFIRNSKEGQNGERRALLPPAAFAESVLEGLAASGEAVLGLFNSPTVDVSGNEELSRLHAKQAVVEATIRATHLEMDALLQRTTERKPDGTLRLSGGMLDRANEAYNKLEEITLSEAEAERDKLIAKIAELEEALPDPADVSVLLHLAASLRNPSDITYRPLWIASMHNLRFKTKRSRREGRVCIETWWTGALKVSGGGEVVLIPFRGHHEAGRKYSARGRSVSVERLVDELAVGRPFSDLNPRDFRRMRSAVAKHLGVSARHPILSCTDPDILRCTFAVVRHPDDSDDTIASELGVDLALVRRVRSLRLGEGSTSTWLTRGNRTLTALFASAARDGATSVSRVVELSAVVVPQVYNEFRQIQGSSTRWTSEGKQGYRLAPCECGAMAAVPLRILEPVGAVCLGCRRDDAGMVWPADLYDQYTACPEIWAAAGHPLLLK